MTKKGKKIIRDVFLVPKLDKNLVSVPQMIANGYQVIFKQSSCIIHDQARRKIAEVNMVKKSFHINWSSSEETTLVAKGEVVEHSNLKSLQPFKQRFMMLECLKPEVMDQQFLNPKEWIEKKVEAEYKPVEDKTKKDDAEVEKLSCCQEKI